ncbi:MAG TPA: PIG-L deacetylase family protein [Gammaproteobacteria bacterium]|nr:PIG-L deacetylase family protein [Gammaproteobacteria bacterium]
MLGLTLNLPRRKSPTILLFGAHSDDIEIGCGGTVLELLRLFPNSHVCWVVLSAGSSQRVKEAKRAAKAMLRTAKKSTVIVKDFRGAFFPAEHTEIKEYFEEVKRSVDPDLIFAHYRDDLHQDHRVVGELVWNTFRDHTILEYEIPKYDGGMGSPSVFVPLSAASMRKKVATLMKVFESQRAKQWFTPSTFEGLMRLRGIECNAASGFAEAFYSRKIVLGDNDNP